MLNQKYRTCTDYKEILRILQKSCALQENILWQTTIEGKTIIRPQHIEIDFVSRGLTVYFDGFKYMVDTAMPLFVKLEHHNSVFKVPTFQLRQHSIHFPFPQLLKTVDQRSNPRYTLDQMKDNFATLRPTRTPLAHEVANEIRVRLVDVSINGLGVMIYDSNRPFLKNNRFLWVMEMNSIRLEQPSLAEVAYISSELDSHYQKRGHQKELKVGLKLSGEFPMEFFERIIAV